MVIWNGASEAAHYKTSSYSLTEPFGKWKNFIWTYSGNAAKFYVDGVEQTVTTSAVTNYPLVGTFVGRSYSYVSGGFDDVRIYNRAVSVTEVKALYNAGQASTNKAQVNRPSVGLLGHWTFDGPDVVWSSATAGTAVDRSGNGLTASFTGMNRKSSPAPGRLGQALISAGSSSYVTTPSLGSPPTSITLAAWVKPNPAGGVVMSEIGQATVNTGWHDSHMEVETNNSIKVCVWAGSATCVVAATGITYGKWYHVVMTYSQPETKISGYVNGVLGNSLTVTKQYPATLYYGIGAPDTSSGGVTAGFSGVIDDVRIYSRALKADEVKRLYNLGR